MWLTLMGCCMSRGNRDHIAGQAGCAILEYHLGSMCFENEYRFPFSLKASDGLAQTYENCHSIPHSLPHRIHLL